MMRLPGSFNGKRGRWCRVLRADRSRSLVDPDQVRKAIHDPEPPPGRAPRSNGYQRSGEDELARVDTPSYFRALAGVEVPADGGMIPCPLPDHQDSHASCQVSEAERGWWCFGCAAAGGYTTSRRCLPAERGVRRCATTASGALASWCERRSEPSQTRAGD
jgi:hypothetical protein